MNQAVTVDGNLAESEVQSYVSYVAKTNPGRTLKSLHIEPDGDYVNLTYELEPVSFERIRRITGYLVGTTDRWNNAKLAELKDRVKHEL